MAIKDIRSDLLPQLAFNGAIGSNTDTFGAAIDSADFDGGNVFTFFAEAFTDGTFAFGIQEDDDAGFSAPADIEAGRLIGDPSTLDVTSAAGFGDTLGSLGCFGNKRFIRLKITSTGVSTGATIVSTVHQVPELSPAATL